VDTRDNWKCNLNNWILMASSIFIVIIIGFKFLAALRFGLSSDPEDYDKFVVIQIPCYTEGPESLAKTLESIAMCRYDDRRKLMMIICDGMIIGSGNDRPTPRIVLDLLGVDPSIDPEPKAFQSLGEGDKQLNYAKVYSGLYEVQGHSVPYIVVVKVGKPSERQRPGNRGKRDSQLILMRYFNRVHFNSEMNPLELEMYHHMKNIIGVNPSLYEFVMMVDADTEVMPDSMNRMVSAMIHDSKIVGLCGETLLSNEKESFITMIQVYEYFISHHLSKCFESLFGSVTCLPGCFCMYRIRTPTKNIPLLISPAVVQDYSVNRVDTLHLKVIPMTIHVCRICFI
jgi:chitin synthase